MRLLALFVGVALALACFSPAAIRADEPQEESARLARLGPADPTGLRLLVGVVEKGRALIDSAAAALEARLKEQPGDLAARLELLGWASKNEQGQARIPGLLAAFVERHGRDPVGGFSAEILAYVGGPEEAWEPMRRAWDALMADDPANSEALGNAGYFLTHPNAPDDSRESGCSLLRRARDLAPSDRRWTARLAVGEAERVWTAFLEGVAPEVDAGREARRVLEDFVGMLSGAERAQVRLHTEPADRMLAKAAWAAGDREAARKRAMAVLAAEPPDNPSWDHGNVLHEMNILLGRVALEEGDLGEAKRRLLEAANTKGSPQLHSFGPDWTLARDLLARGERGTVLAYVERVGSFWESGRDRLEPWRKTLEAGGTPEFLPAPKERRPKAEKEGAERKAPEPPSSGPAKGLVGLWESTSHSLGGLGGAIEFQPDGSVRSRIVVLVDGRYRIEGDRLVLIVGGDAVRKPLGTFERDTWTIAVEGGAAFTKRRVGTATPGAPAVVGVWAYAHYTGAKAFERYGADGWMSLRVLMPDLRNGTYAKTPEGVRMTFSGKSEDSVASITGARLRLVSKDGQVLEYRYGGETPWYDLGVGP